jgi:hypothetical protein
MLYNLNKPCPIYAVQRGYKSRKSFPEEEKEEEEEEEPFDKQQMTETEGQHFQHLL